MKGLGIWAVYSSMKYKTGDIIKFRSNQPNVHLLEMFGDGKFNPDDVKAEEYYGVVLNALPLDTYNVRTLKPLDGFICLVAGSYIICKVNQNEIPE